MKKKIIRELKDTLNITLKDADIIYDEFLFILTKYLLKNRYLCIHLFGTFYIQSEKVRINNELKKINRIRFKPSVILKKIINKK
jgi:nucleoid DNA-binding protein